MLKRLYDDTVPELTQREAYIPDRMKLRLSHKIEQAHL